MKAGIMLGQLSDQGNEGALVRTAEALGISDVHYVTEDTDGDVFIPQDPSGGANRHVDVHEYDSYTEFGRQVTADNHEIVCVTNVGETTALHEMGADDWPTNPIFAVGNESEAIPHDVRAHSTTMVEIPLSTHGYVRCLNAAVAGAIVMEQWHESLL